MSSVPSPFFPYQGVPIYLNRRANEFLGGKSSWKFHFFGGSGCFYFACFGGLFYFLVRQHIMDLFSAILSALVMGFLEGTNTFSLGMPWRASSGVNPSSTLLGRRL